MRATKVTAGRTARSAARIARDVGAIVALAGERVALHVEERRRVRPLRARDVRWKATWTAAAVGAAASLPATPMLSVAAAALEAGVLAEIEARASARLAAMAAGEVTGAALASRALGARRVAFRAGARKAALLVAEHAARAGVRIVLKEVGFALPRLGLRAVVGGAAPLLAAAWSAAWNGLDMHRRLTPAVRAVEATRVDAFARRTPAAAPLAPPAALPPWSGLASGTA